MASQWLASDLVVDGIKIHYTRTGDGSKPPVVLAHGFSDNGLCWLPTAQALEADYDVVMPDARGHGLSARVQPGEELNRADDLARLIRGLGLKQPVVMGHSMGASTTAALAVQHPGLAFAIVLEDPAWFDRPAPVPGEQPAPRKNPFHDFLITVPSLSVEQLMNNCRAQNPGWAEVELRPWAEAKKQLDLNVLQTLDRLLMNTGDIPQRIACPTLLVTADTTKGAIVTPEYAQKVVAANPHIQWAAVPGAGHNIRRENFPVFLQAVKDFLRSIAY